MKTTREVRKALFLGGAVLLLILTLVSHAVAQTCLQPLAGLVGWWPGDGNADDIVGSNDGMLQNGVTFANGMVGQAFSFNGGGAVVEVPDAPSLNFNTNAPISVDLWAFRTGTNPVMHLIGKREGCGDIGLNYQMAFNNTSGEGLGFGAGPGREVATGIDLPLNTWAHLAGTFDGTTYRFYINGQLVATSEGTLGEPTTAPFLIGGSGGCTHEPFVGLIDEVELFNRALSAEEVAAIFNAGSAGKCKALSGFSSFFIKKLDIDFSLRDGKDSFYIEGGFVPGAASNGINVLEEAVTIEIGGFSAILPAGSFVQDGARNRFIGWTDGVMVKILKRGSEYYFQVHAQQVDLGGKITNLTTLRLLVGDDSGEVNVRMRGTLNFLKGRQ